MTFRRLFIALCLLLLPSTAHATAYYFSTSGSNGNDGLSSTYPKHSINGTTLANANAFACGDTINLKRGDVWEGSYAQFIFPSWTTACSSNPPYIQAYGLGANPVLAGAAVTTAGWAYTGANGIYTLSGQSQSKLMTVTQNDNKALGTLETWYTGKWFAPGDVIVKSGLFYRSTGAPSGWDYHQAGTWATDLAAGKWTLITMPEGTFVRDGTTLYVRLWSNANPATSSVRIGNYAHTEDGGGQRGLLSSGRRTNGSTYGHYVRFRDITIIGANGVGFSASGTHNKTAGLNIIGAGADGYLGYSDLTGSGENSDYLYDYGSTISYSASGANGAAGGWGQGVTTYSSFNAYFKTYSTRNFMAGWDALNFGPSINVTETICLWCVATYNGLSQTNPSYDPNFYMDGATKTFLYGIQAWGSGVGSGTAANPRSGIGVGSEHPTTDPAQDTYIINSLVYGSHWMAANFDNSDDSNNIKNVTIAYSTFAAYDAGTFDMVLAFEDPDPTADNYKVRNNIFISDSALTSYWMPSGAYLDADNNQYYRRSGTSYIYSTNGGTTNYTLDGSGGTNSWRTLSGEDASSAYGNPLLVTDSDTGTDAHLGDGSPAIDRGMVNAYTVPSWLPVTVRNYLGTAGIRGTTRASGVIDDFNTAPDAGFHYDYPDLTSTNVEPASLIASTAGNVTVTFTIPDPMGWIPYNGYAKVTFPAGFTLNSGGTTGIVSSTISGTLTASVSGQVVTVTRSGDGNSEFPGDFNVVLTNIQTPSSAGSAGVYSIIIYDSNNNIISGDSSVASDTIISSGGGGGEVTPAHFGCNSATLKGVSFS